MLQTSFFSQKDALPPTQHPSTPAIFERDGVAYIENLATWAISYIKMNGIYIKVYQPIGGAQ